MFPVECKFCGLLFRSLAFEADPSAIVTTTLIGCTETCPRCGSQAEIASGTYELVKGAIAAFAAPGMTRAKVIAATKVAEEAKLGDLSNSEAYARLMSIDESLAALVKQSDGSFLNWPNFFAILALLQAFWISYQSDEDVREALSQAEKQTELSEQMLEELERQSAREAKGSDLGVLPAKMPNSRRSPSALPLNKSQPNANRKERRKQAALNRRRGKKR